MNNKFENLENENNIDVCEKLKKKKEEFINRMNNILEIPEEIKTKFTLALLNEEVPNILINVANDINSNVNNNEINPDVKEDLIQEMEEIVSNLELFAREKRKKMMIMLMEKIADNLDNDITSPEELTDFLFYGNRTHLIEKEYLLTKKQRDGNFLNNNNSNKKKKDDKRIMNLNQILLDDDLNYLQLTKNNKKKTRKSLGKRKRCFKCYKKEIKRKNILEKCGNCPAVYHLSCENFKAVFIKNDNLSVLMCANCLNLYKDKLIISDSFSNNHDCQYEIVQKSNQIKFRCPNFENGIKKLRKTKFYINYIKNTIN
jgi:hypothetical protein